MSQYIEEEKEFTLPKWNPIINNNGDINHIIINLLEMSYLWTYWDRYLLFYVLFSGNGK